MSESVGFTVGLMSAPMLALVEGLESALSPVYLNLYIELALNHEKTCCGKSFIIKLNPLMFVVRQTERCCQVFERHFCLFIIFLAE